MQLPNHMTSLDIMREQQQTAIDRAIVRSNKEAHEALRKKRADHDAQAFLKDRTREVWQK